MVALITLDVAKATLRVDTTDDDADITRKIAQASAIVLNYIKKTIGTPAPDNPNIVDWDVDTVPDDIAAGVEMVLYQLYDDRNIGESDNPNLAMGYLPPQATAILHRWRDPALA